MYIIFRETFTGKGRVNFSVRYQTDLIFTVCVTTMLPVCLYIYALRQVSGLSPKIVRSVCVHVCAGLFGGNDTGRPCKSVSDRGSDGVSAFFPSLLTPCCSIHPAAVTTGEQTIYQGIGMHSPHLRRAFNEQPT